MTLLRNLEAKFFFQRYFLEKSAKAESPCQILVMTDELLVACGQLDLSQDDDFTSKEDPVQEIDWLSDTKIAEWLRN